MGTIGEEIRYGVRMLVKHRLTTVVCVVAVAAGLGAESTVVNLAEAFLLHPVPFENANRLVALVDSHADANGISFGQDQSPVAPATYFEWKKEAHSFDEITAYAWNELNLTGNPSPQKIQAFQVSANFFETVGVQPQLGRMFLSEEEEAGKDQEIILGHALWEQRYASDPHVIGKNIKVNGKSFTIVGVMSKGFDFPKPAEAWIPLSFDVKERLRRNSRWLFVLGRLKPGVPFAQGAAEMQSISQRQAQAYPDTSKGFRLYPRPLQVFVTGDLTRQYTFLLLGAVGFVLLIACADVANVQFARVTGRQKELAVRTAIGASRGRTIRQLLIESVLLSLVGAVLGLFLAHWQLTLMLQHMPPDVAKFIAGWDTIRLDVGAFCFALAIVVASGLLSGVAPALLVSRTNVSETLKESGRASSTGRARHRLRSALVVAEVALSLVLLVGAGLLVKGFYALLTVNDYLHPETLLSLSMNLPELKYARNETRLSFDDRTLQRISSLPHVQSVALASAIPYANGGGVDADTFSVEGRN